MIVVNENIEVIVGLGPRIHVPQVRAFAIDTETRHLNAQITECVIRTPTYLEVCLYGEIDL